VELDKAAIPSHLQDVSLISRREVIQTVFFGTAFSRLAKASSNERVLLHVNQRQSDGIMKVRLSDFPVLKREFGSVRIGTSAIDANQMPVGVFYPVLINRGIGAQFYALDTSCSHAGCTVPPLDSSAHIIQCRCHGSKYAINGSLLQGPAGFGLRSFNINFDGNDELRIEIPGLVFGVEAKKVESGPKSVALNFLTFANIDYQIQYCSNLVEEPRPIPFSLLPEGPFDQTLFQGIDDYVTLYVNAASGRGFFEAAMLTKEV
jgi:Rieske Fe-S protein